MDELVQDKAIEYLMDMTDNENLSECCGAPIIAYSFCKDCMEHCVGENQ